MPNDYEHGATIELVRSHEDALARSLGGERVSALVRALADLAGGAD